MITFLKRFLTFICVVYGIVIIAYLVGYALLGDSPTPIGLLANVMPLPLLPALILLPLALIARRWLGVALILPALVMLIVNYVGLFVPTESQAAQDPPLQTGVQTFTVLTFNTLAKQRTVDETFQIIRDADADIVLIQELNINLADVISEQLAQAYPYQFLRSRTFSVTGMGMISKYPLQEGEYWREAAHWGRQTAWITIGERRIAVFNVHALAPFARGRGFYDDSRRDFDIDTILNWFATTADTEYQIAAGDFNMTDQTLHYREMTAQFSDAHHTIGVGFAPTFPNFNRAESDSSFPLTWIPPLIRIDYVFHAPTLRALDARTLPDSGESDHYPVLVTLGFEN